MSFALKSRRIALLSVAVGCLPTGLAAADYTPVRAKHCVPFERGSVGIYAYDGNDTTRTTPVSGFDNVPTQAITVLGCNYVYCDVVYKLTASGRSTDYVAYDTNADSTLQAAAGPDNHFDPHVENGLNSCVQVAQ